MYICTKYINRNAINVHAYTILGGQYGGISFHIHMYIYCIINMHKRYKNKWITMKRMDRWHREIGLIGLERRLTACFTRNFKYAEKGLGGEIGLNGSTQMGYIYTFILRRDTQTDAPRGACKCVDVWE